MGDALFKVPIFYYDGEQMTGVFPARLSGLRKMLPDRRMAPARLAPGVGAITVTCFEYRDTDIDPYNELAIAIPLNEPYYRPNLPGRALVDSIRRSQFDNWIHHLPVTTELARAGGKDFYNYPKFVGGIDYEEAGTERTCRLSEGAEPILSLKCEKLAGSGSEQIQLFSHLYQNREPQSSEFKILAHDTGRSIRRGAATLELADRHPIARELHNVLLSRRSIAAVYSPRIEGILYGPHHATPEVLEKLGVLAPAESTA
ncbi:MAG: acetoacetate decarboxylase family protein [Thermoleophilaceae bacterium]|nr:acetoacetate decarboxylase family protein [Thermoleophilaceae bacterium]